MAVNAIACAAVGRPAPARQDPGWPAYLGAPAHDRSAGERLNPDPRPLWRAAVGRAVRGSPALGESVIAVGTAERLVVVLDRASGEPFWRVRVAGPVHAGPLIDGDRLYVATEGARDGRVYALRLRDGEELWSRRTGSVTAPLALDGPALYAATEGGTVLRLDLETGRPAWRTALSGAVRAGPVPAPQGIAVATTQDTLYLLDRRTGAVRARRALPGAVLATPALDGDRLFLGTTAGHVLEIALPGLEVRWDHHAGDAVFGAPALVRDTLYVTSRDGVLWIIPVDAPGDFVAHALDIVGVAGPTPTRSGILVAGVSGEVVLVDPTSGGVRWRARVEGPVEQPPLVLDRQLVVVGGRGDIHAYR